jgi:hypothetical protein
LSGEGKPVAERGKDSIQLSLVTFIEQPSYIRAWLDPQLQQMATHDERGGGLVFNFQSKRALKQPGSCRKSVKGFWREARVIGPRDSHQSVDPFYLPSQSANRAV